jgi:hypothetical protein
MNLEMRYPDSFQGAVTMPPQIDIRYVTSL